MNRLLSKLPLLAFVLAAFAAVAFGPARELPQDMYGYDPQHGWINVNSIPPGASVECNSTGDCLYDEPGGTPLTEGTFKYNPPVLP